MQEALEQPEALFPRSQKGTRETILSECFLKSQALLMSNAPTKQKLWGGRFTGKTDPL